MFGFVRRIHKSTAPKYGVVGFYAFDKRVFFGPIAALGLSRGFLSSISGLAFFSISSDNTGNSNGFIDTSN